MATLKLSATQEVDIQVLIFYEFKSFKIRGIKLEDYTKNRFRRLAEIYALCRGYTPHNNPKLNIARLQAKYKQMGLPL